MVNIQGTTCRYIICIIHKSSSLEIWFWNSVLVDNLLVYTNTWTTFLTQLSSNVKHHCISALNLTKNSYYVCMYMDEMCLYVNQPHQFVMTGKHLEINLLVFAFYMYTRHNSVISIVQVKYRWHSMALSSISQISWSLEVKSRCWSIFRWNISEIVKFIKIQIIVIACHYGKMIDGNCYHQNLIIIMLLIVKTLCFSIHLL